MLEAGENVRYSTVQGIVRRATPYGEHGVATEHALGKDALERNPYKSFLLHLAFDSMNGVAKKTSAALNVPGMLVLASRM